MKTKIPTVNFLTNTIYNNGTEFTLPGTKGDIILPHSQHLLPPLLSEGHMLLICIQDVKRLFVLKTPIF